jgi:hypothetical protein
LAFRTIESPLFCETNENGPVPIGLVAMRPLSTLLRDTIAMPLKPPMLVSRLGVGCFTLSTTVRSSGAVTSVTLLNLSTLDSFSSMIRR